MYWPIPLGTLRLVFRENAVIGTCVALTVAAVLLVEALSASYPERVPLAPILGGGVSTAINEDLNRREAA